MPKLLYNATYESALLGARPFFKKNRAAAT